MGNKSKNYSRVKLHSNYLLSLFKLSLSLSLFCSFGERKYETLIPRYGSSFKDYNSTLKNKVLGKQLLSIHSIETNESGSERERIK